VQFSDDEDDLYTDSETTFEIPSFIQLIRLVDNYRQPDTKVPQQ